MCDLDYCVLYVTHRKHQGCCVQLGPQRKLQALPNNTKATPTPTNAAAQARPSSFSHRMSTPDVCSSTARLWTAPINLRRMMSLDERLHTLSSSH